MKLDPIEDEIEEWEEGLTPFQRFEKLVQYGQIGKLAKNSFFRSLDKAGQMGAISDALDHLIHQLDIMSQHLMKVSSTHPEGVKLNRLAVELTRAKRKMLSDFASGIEINIQIGEKNKGDRYF